MVCLAACCSSCLVDITSEDATKERLLSFYFELIAYALFMSDRSETKEFYVLKNDTHIFD